MSQQDLRFRQLSRILGKHLNEDSDIIRTVGLRIDSPNISSLPRPQPRIKKSSCPYAVGGKGLHRRCDSRWGLSTSDARGVGGATAGFTIGSNLYKLEES